MRITEFPMIEEVKEEYLQLRYDGNDREAATAELIRRYHNEITEGEEDDGLLFWIGLADAQYFFKELTKEAAEQGLSAVERLAQTDWCVTPGDLKRRRERYAFAPMPEKVNVKKPKKFRCVWQMGDTFAYHLSGAKAEECGLAGRYVLFRKVDEMEFGDGSLYPVVTVTLWDDRPLPCNAVEFQRLPMLRVAYGRLGAPSYLYEYRTELLFRSNRQLAGLGLRYLGNFEDVPMPSDEFIIRHPGEVSLTLPEQIDEGCCIFWKRHNRCGK